MSESGGRYQRSAAGMIGAMIVTIGVIVAFVAFRAASRDDLVVDREPVDYLAVVDSVQESGGLSPAYPPTLPAGWLATAVDHEPGRLWSLTLLTGERRFVGVRQGTQSVERLVEEFVDDATQEGDTVELDSALAPTWRSFTDDGGDYALAAEVAGSIVLVVGTAEVAEIEELTASLIQTPVS